MNTTIARRLWPHLAAFGIMLLIAAIFYKPAVFDGKVLTQPDNVKAIGMATEIRKIEKETGKAPLWTNAQFSGMPSYQIHQTIEGNYLKPIFSLLFLWQGIRSYFAVTLLAMLSCYFLLLTLKIDWRLALFGAIAFGISTYQVDLMEAGHSTKLATLAILPAVFAAAVLTFRGKYLLGGGLFALFLGLDIYANHVQITFYGLLLLAIFGLIELVNALKTKNLAHFGQAAGILVFASLIAVLCNTSKLWPTYEYSTETIRGKSELKDKASLGGGLTKDYAFGWSYGIGETLTILIPQFMGGGAAQTFKGTDSYKRVFPLLENQLIKQGTPRADAKKSAERQLASMFYHGNQPFVGVAIYFGAIICFLFVLGAFLAKGDLKMWLLLGGLFAIMIAWGNNFFVNILLFDYFPMFNKFRAVSMALGIAQLAFIGLAFLGLQKMVDKTTPLAAKKKALYFSTGIVGGLCILALLGSSFMDFSGNNDSNFGPDLTALLKADRASILRKDALRSLLFILLAAGLLWTYLLGKIKALPTILAIGLFTILDIWLIDTRILYPEKYEEPSQVEASVQPLPADKKILEDKDPDFRVLDLARGNPFLNTATSYFHKSVGGYHAAKLMRYQDLIEHYLNTPTKYKNILGMLNTKYIIQGRGAVAKAIRNPSALGNAWFVKEYQIVADGDAEMDGLEKLEPGKEALIQQKFAAPLQGLTIIPDSNAYIRLTHYHPDTMRYEYEAATEQLAVFSEVYYPPEKGWSLYLDGKKTDPFFKADFLLRAARLPAGKHALEMRFEPRSFYLGEKISRAASGLTLLLFFGGLVFFFKNNTLPEAEQLDEVETPSKKLRRTKVKRTQAKVSSRRRRSKK